MYTERIQMEIEMSRYKQPYSLYKRGNYYYYKTYSPDGVRTCGKTTGCTSKNQARAFCDQLYIEGKLWSKETKYAEYTQTFFDADGLYFTDRQKKASPHTIAQYQSIQKNHLLPYFKKINLSDINYTTIKTFRLHLTNKGLSIKSITLIMTVLKVVIEYAFRDRLILTDPFIYIKPLKDTTTKHRDAFTLEEVKIVYDRIGERFKNQVLVMALTGMRIKESLCQTPDDVVDADGFSYIDLKYQIYNSSRQPLKHGSVRQIPIIPELKDYLYFNEQVNELYNAIQDIKCTFENYEQRNLSFHSLRHFFITNSKSSGVPPIKVEYLAGHSLKGMEQIYTNFRAADCTEILEWQRKIFEYLTK